MWIVAIAVGHFYIFNINCSGLFLKLSSSKLLQICNSVVDISPLSSRYLCLPCANARKSLEFIHFAAVATVDTSRVALTPGVTVNVRVAPTRSVVVDFYEHTAHTMVSQSIDAGHLWRYAGFANQFAKQFDCGIFARACCGRSVAFKYLYIYVTYAVKPYHMWPTVMLCAMAVETINVRCRGCRTVFNTN